MNRPLKDIHIHHFRSIRDCSLLDLRQINVIIGRPNTGKTNLIDALSLYSIPELSRQGIRLNELIRLETPEELFHVKSVVQYASLTSNRGECFISYDPGYRFEARLAFDYSAAPDLVYLFDQDFQHEPTPNLPYPSPITRYGYDRQTIYQHAAPHTLAVPKGNNLFQIIQHSPHVRKALESLLRETGIKLAYTTSGPVIMTPIPGTTDLRELPFSSLSDSLQRMIFYLTAIVSNNEKVLLVDNIDAEIFPTFLSRLAAEMIDNSSNQYIFSTHDPFILTDLLEASRDHLAVFVTYMQDRETHVHRLTCDDLDSISNYGMDALINIESFIPKP